MKFLDRLNLALKQSGMTRAALAEKLGIASSTITRWNHGAEPRPDLMNRIAQLTGVRLQWLTTGIEPMEPRQHVLGPGSFEPGELSPEFRATLQQEAKDYRPDLDELHRNLYWQLMEGASAETLLTQIKRAMAMARDENDLEKRRMIHGVIERLFAMCEKKSTAA